MEFVSQTISFINQGWVGSLIGLIGVMLGVAGLLFFRAAKAKPRPAYQVDALRLIEKRGNALPDEFSINYKGSPVQRLTKTNLIFWNAGADTLRWSDVVGTDPLRMVFDDEAEILRADIVKSTRDINACNLVADQNDKGKLLLEFDFLDPGDGVSIELLHTSKAPAPSFLGSIRGVPEGILNWGRILKGQGGRPLVLSIFRARKPICIAGIFIGMVFFLFGLLPESIMCKLSESCTQDDKSDFPRYARYIFMLIGLLYAALPASLLWSGRKRFPKTLDFDKDKVEET